MGKRLAFVSLPSVASHCGQFKRYGTVTCVLSSEKFAVKIATVAAAATLTLSPGINVALSPTWAQDILVFDHDQTLVGADFSGRKDLVGAIFSKSNATRSNFSNADLHNAQLDDTVLIEAVLDNAGKS